MRRVLYFYATSCSEMTGMRIWHKQRRHGGQQKDKSVFYPSQKGILLTHLPEALPWPGGKSELGNWNRVHAATGAFSICATISFIT